MTIDSSKFIQESIEYTQQDIRHDTYQIIIDTSLLGTSLGIAGAGVSEILLHKNVSDGLVALGAAALIGGFSSITIKDDLDAWLSSKIKLANLEKLSNDR
jgi:uncharacterized membrane-anchored protein